MPDKQTTAHGQSKAEAEGHKGQTTDNNIDPARKHINPQVLSQDEFARNTLTYGMPVPTGCTSTWDRRLTKETEMFHQRVAKEYSLTPTSDAHHSKTSINNYLAGQMTGTGESAAPAEGRQRGIDVQEPAHHFAFHDPTVKDRVHGAVNVAAGTLRMDQDIATRGKAEFKGQTEDGH